MAVTFVSYTAGGSGATGNVTVTYPATGVTIGDLFLLSISLKSTAAVVTTPAGYTLIADASNTSGTDGGDTGPVRSILYYKVAAGTEGGTTFTLTVTTGTGFSSGIVQYRNATGVWDLSAFTTETQSTATSPMTFTGNLGANVVSAGDILLYQTALNTDTNSIGAVTRTYPAGITNTYVEQQDRSASTGNDTRIVLMEATITGGSASGNFSISAPYVGTLVAGVSPFAATILVRLKEVAATASTKKFALLGVG